MREAFVGKVGSWQGEERKIRKGGFGQFLVYREKDNAKRQIKLVGESVEALFNRMC